MLVPRRNILDYRAKIDGNQSAVGFARALATEVSTLEAIIKLVRPDLEKEYEFWRCGFVLPQGNEFDELLALAAADVRATRAPGDPETNPEMYITRVPVKQDAETAEEVVERQASENEEASAERRAAQAAHMKKLRAARDEFGWKEW